MHLLRLLLILQLGSSKTFLIVCIAASHPALCHAHTWWFPTAVLMSSLVNSITAFLNFADVDGAAAWFLIKCVEVTALFS